MIVIQNKLLFLIMNEKYRQPHKRTLGKEFKLQEFEKVFRGMVYVLM